MSDVSFIIPQIVKFFTKDNVRLLYENGQLGINGDTNVVVDQFMISCMIEQLKDWESEENMEYDPKLYISSMNLIIARINMYKKKFNEST